MNGGKVTVFGESRSQPVGVAGQRMESFGPLAMFWCVPAVVMCTEEDLVAFDSQQSGFGVIQSYFPGCDIYNMYLSMIQYRISWCDSCNST